MNYAYLVLVAAGLVMAIFGFVRNGQSQHSTLGAAVVFVLGIVALTLGILLTSVPGFFSG